MGKVLIRNELSQRRCKGDDGICGIPDVAVQCGRVQGEHNAVSTLRGIRQTRLH